MTTTDVAVTSSAPPGPPPEPRVRLWQWQLLVVVVGVGLWQAGVSTGVLSEQVFPEPLGVLRWTWEWHASGASLPDLSATLTAVALGYATGVLAGALVATLLVFVPFLGRVFDPFMGLINGVPKIVLAPLFILVFGLGLSSKVATAALLVFVVSYFNFAGGLRSINRIYIDHVRCLGAARAQMARYLYVPAMATWTVTTLRVALSFAFLGVVVGEFVSSSEGLGRVIKVSASLLEQERLFGAFLTLAVLAACIDRVLVAIERKASAWKL